jgi:membrane protein implicated in regulation of membrane protease activity
MSERLKQFLYENGLTLTFLGLFFAALVGQAISGYHEFNSLQVQHASSTIGFGRYITSSDFGSGVMENWQSEYLQFTLFILMTVFLLQRGSPESKELGKQGTESDREQRLDGRRGFRVSLYSNSLVLVMGLIWIGSWLAQSITGYVQFNADRFSHQQDAIPYGSYLGSAHFWQTTFQNWQSEFLAVASMAILAVYLRQRGSPESKPVGAPHDATGLEG